MYVTDSGTWISQECFYDWCDDCDADECTCGCHFPEEDD